MQGLKLVAGRLLDVPSYLVRHSTHVVHGVVEPPTEPAPLRLQALPDRPSPQVTVIAKPYKLLPTARGLDFDEGKAQRRGRGLKRGEAEPSGGRLVESTRPREGDYPTRALGGSSGSGSERSVPPLRASLGLGRTTGLFVNGREANRN